MSRRSLFFTFLLQSSLLLSFPNSSFAQQCWFPDGVTLSPADTPCQNTTSGEYTACCGSQADGSRTYCLSNGLCWGNMIVSRGSCTDQSWKSEACGQYCLGMPAGGVVMTPCSATTWGCGLNCEANTFPVAIGTLQITEANYAELGINNVTTPQAPSVSMPTSALAAATMPVATTPTNAVATACAVIFPPPTNASVVGIGVGVPLGLAFAITALLFLNERKKLIKIRRARTLIPNGGAAKVLHQAPDPEKRQYLQSYPSQLPYQQSYQPSYREPRSASTFQEAGGSPVAKEIYGGEEEMSQELP